jgi:hypothetical protein
LTQSLSAAQRKRQASSTDHIYQPSLMHESCCCLTSRKALDSAQTACCYAQWHSPASPRPPRLQVQGTKGCRLGTTLALSMLLPPASARPRSNQHCADHTASLQSVPRPHRSRHASCRSGAIQTLSTAQRCLTRSVSGALRQHLASRWSALAGWGEFSTSLGRYSYLIQDTGNRSWPSSTATAPLSARRRRGCYGCTPATRRGWSRASRR